MVFDIHKHMSHDKRDASLE